MKQHAQCAAHQRDRCICVHQLQRFRTPRVHRSCCHQNTGRTVAQGKQCCGKIFCFDTVNIRRAHTGGNHLAHAHEAAKQVQSVDRLRQQHAAAVARYGATPGLVVVAALRAPPGNLQNSGLQLAQRCGLNQLSEPHRAGSKPVLQDHAELQTGAVRKFDQLLRFGQADVKRLFHQGMFARCQCLPCDVQVGMRGRGHDHRVDFGILQHVVKDGRHSGMRRHYGARALEIALCHSPAQVHTVVQLSQACKMRLRARADPDQGDANFSHLACSCVARACASRASLLTVNVCSCEIAS